MELVGHTSCANSVASNSFSCLRSQIFNRKNISCLNPKHGFRSTLQISTQRSLIDSRERRSLIAQAKKKKNDSHSHVPKPDEATGPFPEAVLLKKRTVQENGRLVPEFADAEEEKLFEFLNLQLESDLNIDRIRHYEVVYLIHEDHIDDVGSVISKVEGFIKEKNGKIWRLNNWGLRRLAYKIKKAKNANYILMNFEIGAEWINEFKTMLDKDERIIRHLVIKRDEAITEDCPPPLEFHTLRANGLEDDGGDGYDADDDEDDDVDDDGEDWDDESELDMINYSDDNDVDGDDDEDLDDESASVRKETGRTLKLEKIAR